MSQHLNTGKNRSLLLCASSLKARSLMQHNGAHVNTRFKTYRLHGICGANLRGMLKEAEVDIDNFKISWRVSNINVS